MDTDSFLPDGEIPVAKALAWTGFSREDFAKVAEGADPESFRQGDRVPLWGILYVSRESVGFYVHPGYPSGIVGLFSADKDPTPAIHLRVPFVDVVSARSSGIRKPKTAIGRFFATALLKSESDFILSWKAQGQDAPYEARFFVEKDADAFDRAVREALSGITRQ